MTDPRGKRIQRYAPSQVPSSTPAELRTWLTSEFRSVAAVQTNAEWDSITDAPSDFTPAPHQHDWGDIYGEPSEYPPIPHPHLEADVVDLDRLRWKGAWAPGAYVKNDLVRDGRWLTVALADTTDEPVQDGAPAWAISPEPSWAGANVASVFGMRVLASQDPAVLCAARVKARQAGAFDVWLVLDGLRIDVATAVALTAGAWREFHFQPIVVPSGVQLDIVASGGSYNEAVNYFAGHPLIRGFRTTSYPPSPGDVSANAFGVDAYFFHPVVSPNWQVLL